MYYLGGYEDAAMFTFSEAISFAQKLNSLLVGSFEIIEQ